MATTIHNTSIRLLAATAVALLSLCFALSTNASGRKIINKQQTDSLESQVEQLLWKGDTVPSVLFERRRIGRYDRGLNNYLVVPRKAIAVGITASYGSFDSEDYRILSYVNDLDFRGTVLSVNPSVSYFFRHNQCVGLRGGYTKYNFDLNSLNVDFDEDINFSLRNVYYHMHKLTAEAFYRYYVGLDAGHRFAVFNEVALLYGNGVGSFSREINQTPKLTETSSHELRLNFSPGVSVFVHDRASVNLSFGIFGWYMKHESQKTTDTEPGSSTSSGANFKFNIFNLAFGLSVYI